jgi:sec-independent protein translocase protein TatB
MFNIGSGEIALIAVVALLVLGPTRLPELARGIGKFVREFRRHTDEVRGVVEREFYKMDAPASAPVKDLPIQPAQDAVAANALPEEALPPPASDEGPSQLTAGMPTDETKKS